MLRPGTFSILCTLALMLAPPLGWADDGTSSPAPGLDPTLESLLQNLETLQSSTESVADLKRSLAALARRKTLPPEDLEFFETRIRPALVENCYQCHGPEKQKGGFRLDSSEALLLGGTSGPAILPGDPEGSLLLQAVRYLDPNLQMPPAGKLPDPVIADLYAWIQKGAPDPRTEPTGLSAPPALPMDPSEARNFWSLQPVGDPAPPAVRDTAWVRSPIDAFVLAGLEREGISPAPPAENRVLLRRLTYDLIGLPPTPEEMREFLADSSPDAYEKAVDRLLASPHYGERWGRHWLDVVRYTDSFDSRATEAQDVTDSFKYRDWVVNALNQDMPYDRFLMNQIAGDLLSSKDSPEEDSFNREGIIATGMLAIGNWPGGDADKEKMVTDIVDDQIDVICRGMLGLTVACARCHDHKFDPISTSDYYGLAGIFFSSHVIPKVGPKSEGSPVLKIPLLPPQELQERTADEARMAAIRAEMKSLTETAQKGKALALLPQTSAYLVAAADYRHRSATGGGASLGDIAKEKGLQEPVLLRWLGYLGFEDNRLLTNPVRDIHGTAGLLAWLGEQDSCSVTVNTHDREVAYLTIRQPAKSVAAHPSPQHPVLLAWRCPQDDLYAIRGGLSDADPNGGDGIGWRVSVSAGGEDRTLAEGEYADGGKQGFEEVETGQALKSVPLRGGDLVILSILPKTSHGWDTTVVDLRIAACDQPEKVWDLAQDVLPDPHQGNPHSDRFGNSDVWRFLEPIKQGGEGIAGAALLSEWQKEIGKLVFESPPSASVAQTLRPAADRLGRQVEDFGVLDATAQASAGQSPVASIYQGLISDKSPFVLPFQESDLPESQREPWLALKRELAALEAKPKPPIEYANGIQEGGVPETGYVGVQDVAVHIRGRYDRLGDLVPRRFPVVLAGESQPPIQAGSGRLELARWVASGTNPLTARVFVNRVWKHHLGEGIVRTPGNFGSLGERPTHPELLDWLARDFIRSGWSVKSLHRKIVLSSTYRQASRVSPEVFERDPDNRWFGRVNRRRLEAEAIRDAMLAVSGRLDPTLAGPPFKELSTPRRTLYFKTVRSDRTSFNMLFDAADPTAIIDKRIDTTVAPQALFLLNNPFVLEMAEALADSVLSVTGTSEAERIEGLYERLYGRPVSDREREIGLEALGAGQGEARNRWIEYCQVLLCANEFVYVD